MSLLLLVTDIRGLDGTIKLSGVGLDENVVGAHGWIWLGCVVVVSPGEGKANYLVAGNEACGHFVAILLGAEPVAAGTTRETLWPAP
jgi:hypothetical protein